MASESAPPDEVIEIPEDAIRIKQVRWAWLWASTPWLVVVYAVYSTQVLPIEEVTVFLLTVMIIVPRYFSWRRSEYIITDDTLIYQRGGILKTSRYPIPMAKLSDVRVRFGKFGRALGYQAVDIMLDNGATASLTYIPTLMGVADELRERMPEATPDSEQAQDVGSSPDGPPDEPRTYDPGASRYDPDAPTSDKPPTE
jgi:membrane protein YdbS with pleckstrin-like domain